MEKKSPPVSWFSSTKSRFIMLLFGVLLYSFIAVVSKLAAGFPAFSLGFIFYWGISLGMALIYSLIWQLVLEKIPLVVAYPVVYLRDVLVLLWSLLIFKEAVSLTQFAGAALIIIGVGVSQIGHK